MSEPYVIKLVRHGESEANIGLVSAAEVGDHRIQLTKVGTLQAEIAGHKLGEEFVRNSLLYLSPYRRTRQTMQHLLEGAGVDPQSVRLYEEPRLREIDPGYVSYKKQMKLRQKFGWFYYRFKGGEAPSDVYDRMCHFLESLGRQVDRKQQKSALIVSHGLTIRCFVMRFMHLSVEQFESLDNPENCDVITIAHKDTLSNPQFVSGDWGVEGLRFREPSGETPPPKKSKKKAKKSKK